MSRQKKALPDLRSMISAAAGPTAGAPDSHPDPTTQAGEQPSLAADVGYQETFEPQNQETSEPQNNATKKNRNQRAAEPANQNDAGAAPANALPSAPVGWPETADLPDPSAEAGAPEPLPRLPAVQVCVWIAPEVALATRLPKRPTRSRLVEAVLRKGLADVGALVELLRSEQARADEGRSDD